MLASDLDLTIKSGQPYLRSCIRYLREHFCFGIFGITYVGHFELMQNK